MSVDPSQLAIIHHPNPVLRQKARPIPEITDEVRAVAQRMLDIMHEAPGVGLAAPQVGLSWRLFVANPTGEPEDDSIYINPRFIELGREQEAADEGCLSLPDITCAVRRPITATIEAQNEQGETITLTAEGFPARVWQHEYDHLEGTMIIDKMTPTDRIANRKALKALEDAR
ncbi:peptide deformylase [Mucisphaera sp.]|uniref:peptide deformylase n=1 Tax=Mucisphaera sp. TaxID=2913024 RepID=UPI003D0BC9F2